MRGRCGERGGSEVVDGEEDGVEREGGARCGWAA